MIRALLAILLLTAGTPWRGPQVDTLGVRLKAWSFVEPQPNGGGYGQAYAAVESRPDLEWVSFGLFADTVVAWPRVRLWGSGLEPAKLVLYCDTVRMEAVFQFAVGGPPQLWQRNLGFRIDPNDSWRLRFQGKGEVATVIFAGYLRTAGDVRKATRLRLEPRSIE